MLPSVINSLTPMKFFYQQKQIINQVPICKWITLAKFPWILYTNTCNVNFAGKFVLSRVPQQAKIASCPELRNCEQIPQIKCEISESKRKPLFCLLLY